jgi:hypothetical protein
MKTKISETALNFTEESNGSDDHRVIVPEQ